jgi:hypothetical protein
LFLHALKVNIMTWIFQEDHLASVADIYR